MHASSKLSYCQLYISLLATRQNTEIDLGSMSLFRDFVRILAVVEFVMVESLPACRHAGFSATHGGIVPVQHALLACCKARYDGTIFTHLSMSYDSAFDEPLLS